MSVTPFSFFDGIVNTLKILTHFQENGFAILENALTPDDVKYVYRPFRSRSAEIG